MGAMGLNCSRCLMTLSWVAGVTFRSIRAYRFASSMYGSSRAWIEYTSPAVAPTG